MKRRIHPSESVLGGPGFRPKVPARNAVVRPRWAVTDCPTCGARAGMPCADKDGVPDGNRVGCLARLTCTPFGDHLHVTTDRGLLGEVRPQPRRVAPVLALSDEQTEKAVDDLILLGVARLGGR